MNFVNEIETLDAIMKQNQKLKKAKQDLEVFLNSLEGDSKTATNTEKEQNAIEYWKNVLTKQESEMNRSIAYMEGQIEQARMSFERTKIHLEKQIQQARDNYDANTGGTRQRLAKAEEALEKKMTRKKPKRQLELEMAVQELEKDVKGKNQLMEGARKAGRLL